MIDDGRGSDRSDAGMAPGRASVIVADRPYRSQVVVGDAK
jgi:hypothetical protein